LGTPGAQSEQLWVSWGRCQSGMSRSPNFWGCLSLTTCPCPPEPSVLSALTSAHLLPEPRVPSALTLCPGLLKLPLSYLTCLLPASPPQRCYCLPYTPCHPSGQVGPKPDRLSFPVLGMLSDPTGPRPVSSDLFPAELLTCPISCRPLPPPFPTTPSSGSFCWPLVPLGLLCLTWSDVVFCPPASSHNPDPSPPSAQTKQT
jgi:hypothetical protein